MELETDGTDFFVVSGHLGVKDNVHAVMSVKVSDDSIKFGHFEEGDTAEPLDGSNRMCGISKLGPMGLKLLDGVEGGPHSGDLLEPIEGVIIEGGEIVGDGSNDVIDEGIGVTVDEEAGGDDERISII